MTSTSNSSLICHLVPPGIRSLSTAAAIVSLYILGGCSDNNASKAPPILALSECRVPNVDNAVQCGKYEVFENRETKTGRKIALNIVVLPASARIKEPDPIFLFAGGPGQAATDLVATAKMILGTLNTKRDIVFIDQRGTGKSNLLTCKFPTDDDPTMANADKRRQLTLKLYTECRNALAQKADLTQYGTTTAMADYDEVRAALGYDKINLWGASYGTRSAQEYLRRYPDHVRTVTLDSVASPSLILPENFARDAGAALESVFVACEKSASCNKNYPSMRADFAAMLVRLDKNPQTVMVANPLSGIPKQTTITRDSIAMAAFSTLYAPQLAAMLPEALKQANLGNYAPLTALSGGMTEIAEEKIAIGMRMSVSCNEDVPRITPAMRDAADKIEPFRSSFIREFSTACEVWPKGKVATDFFTPVVSDKPVLILSGGLDPVTPPAFGDEIKQSFSNSVHFVAPYIGHGTSHQGCGPKIVKQFIEKASVAELNGDCLKRLPRPSFYQPMVAAVAKADQQKNNGDKK